MIDLHSHIVFEVDDGSESWEMSCEMLDQVARGDFRYIFATPHFIAYDTDYTVKEMRTKVSKLNEYVQAKGYELKILPGHEVLIDNDLMSFLESGEIQTLGDSRYVLVELPMADMPRYTESVFHEMMVSGYRPILAHPERNGPISENPEILKKLLEKGLLTQLNLKSLTGKYGAIAKKTAEKFLEYGFYHFVGSDAHRPGREDFHMSKEISKLKNLVAIEKWEELVFKNAQFILENKDMPQQNYVSYQKKGWLQKTFFGRKKKGNR